MKEWLRKIIEKIAIEVVKRDAQIVTTVSEAIEEVYDNLENIPTVGDGTITIKQNGTSKGTFTTNQSGNTTIELTDNNTTYSNFVKSGSGAKAGLVPAPSTTAGTTKYLREDGTWTAPPNTNTDTKVTNTLAATTKAYVTGTTSAATNTGTQVFDTDVYLDTTAGQLTAKTFKGALRGNADTATQLATARTIQTNLGSTSSASFNGTANVTPGITGTLPVSHGGTGATTLTSGAALIGNGTGAVTTRAITNNKSKGASGWTSANGDNLITANTLAYWDGAYTGTSSNLARCSKGAFGSIVTKNADDYATATHSHDLSTMINGLSTGTSTPKDADYYVSQYAGGGTTTTTYHRRPMSSLWAYIKSKLATVATSGSYNDLSNKPTIPTVGNGKITITQNGATKGSFTMNQSGNATIALDGGTTESVTYRNTTKNADGSITEEDDNKIVTTSFSKNDAGNRVITEVTALKDGTVQQTKTTTIGINTNTGRKEIKEVYT